MSRTKAVFFGAVSSQLFAVITSLVSLLTAPFVLGHLKSEIYGLSIIIFQITAYLNMFDFGLTASVDRFLAGTRGNNVVQHQKVQHIISTAFIVNAILGLIVAIVGNTLAPYATNIFKIPYSYAGDVRRIIAIISVLLGLQFLLRPIGGIFFAHQKQLLSNTLLFIMNIGNTIFLLLFISMGFMLWSFVYTQIIVFIINAGLNIFLFKKHYSYIKIGFKNFDFSLVKEMFAYGFFIFLMGIATQVIFFTDRVVIGSLISLTAVSIYSFTAKLPELLSLLLWKITDNAFPAMVELSKSDAVSFRTVHDDIMKLTLSLSVTSLWIIILVSYPFITLWVGKEYFAGTFFTILIAYLYLVQLSIIHVTSMCLNGAGIAKQISFMALLEAAINLGLSIWLVREWGLKGALIGTIIAGSVTSFWYIPYLSVKYMKRALWQYAVCIIKPIVACSVVGLGSYFLFKSNFHNINNVFTLILSTAGLGLLFLFPIVWLNKKLLLEIKKKIMLPKVATSLSEVAA